MADEEQTWRRVEAFRTDRLPAQYEAMDPDTFVATMKSVSFDSVHVEVLRAAPFRYRRDADDIASTGQRMVSVVAVGDGAVRGHADGVAIDAEAGDVLVLDSSTELDLEWTGSVRMLQCMLGAHHLPPFMLDGPPLPAGAIPRTALVNSYIAFVSALMVDGSSWPRTPQLVRALTDLTSDVLVEVRSAMEDTTGSAGLRARIESHVMEHLSDRDLTPGSIAAALGLSLRSVHHAFEGQPMTVARLVRERRLDRVASELVDRRGEVGASDLAVRHGFASRDQLARSFRQRYGMTLKEYQAERGAGVPTA